MALLTPLSLDEARRLGAFWDVAVRAVIPLAAGSVNSNFRLELDGGRTLFLRIYEEQAAEGALHELRLVRVLARAGVPTPEPVERADGGLYAELSEKPVAIFPWVEGTTLCQASVTPAHTREVGRALARVHRVEDARAGVGRFERAHLEVRLDRVERSSFAEVGRDLRAQLREIDARRATDIPRGVIHGDLFRDNVLWREGELAALLDFESASDGTFVYDLAVTIEAWCFTTRFEPALVSALVAGYHAVRPLSDSELDAFASEAAFAALRFAVTRITDYSMRAPPGKPPLRDYRRFLERFAQIESGSLDPLVRAGLGR